MKGTFLNKGWTGTIIAEVGIELVKFDQMDSRKVM